jgi:hypothetical protein
MMARARRLASACIEFVRVARLALAKIPTAPADLANSTILQQVRALTHLHCHRRRWSVQFLASDEHTFMHKFAMEYAPPALEKGTELEINGHETVWPRR